MHRRAEAPNPGVTQRHIVEIDADIADLVGPYLRRRAADLAELGAHVDAAAFRDVERIAHRVKGSAGSYGFETLSEIAARLERDAGRSRAAECRAGVAAMTEYLESLEVRVAARGRT